jgi:hypothetical protein
MPGYHSEEEKEHKQRIKKLKAKTSKMRLAVANSNRDKTDPNWKSNEDHNIEYLKKRDKNKRPSYSDGMGNFGDQSLQH